MLVAIFAKRVHIFSPLLSITRFLILQIEFQTLMKQIFIQGSSFLVSEFVFANQSSHMTWTPKDFFLPKSDFEILHCTGIYVTRSNNQSKFITLGISEVVVFNKITT